MAYWSDLPNDLVIRIAEYIKKLEDFTSFGAVCKSWNAVVGKEHFKGTRVRQGTPYFMLSVKDGNDDVRELYGLVEGEITASIKVPSFIKKKCLESMGWLLVIEKEGSMNLLNPFSRVEIPVPHQNTFPDFDELSTRNGYSFLMKMTLSAMPNESSDFVLMVICGSFAHLAFWRPGYKAWNRIETRQAGYTDVVYHDGHFYAIDFAGFVTVFDFTGDHPTEGRIVTCLEDVGLKTPYVLKTSDSLLAIIRNDDTNTMDFKLYEIDMSMGTWKEINSLGRMALFIGHNSTNLVDASRFHCKIKANHIYFSDDTWDKYTHYEEGGGKDMGVYSLETATIEPFYNGELLLSIISPSTWITPCF